CRWAAIRIVAVQLPIPTSYVWSKDLLVRGGRVGRCSGIGLLRRRPVEGLQHHDAGLRLRGLVARRGLLLFLRRRLCAVDRRDLVEDAQEAVYRNDSAQYRDARERKDRQPFERLRSTLLALELGVTIECILRTLLNGPLQLRLRTFERQDARAGVRR